VKSVYSRDYQRLLTLLVEARQKVGITQQELADKLKRPQSFVSKFEHGERRIDVIEFLQISRAIGADAIALIRTLEKER
jgi:transcriptional regulator with XRE-family HTH domain